MLTKGVAACVLLLSVSACGGSDDPKGSDKPTVTPSATLTTDPVSGLPACDGVWKSGQTLAKAYKGCSRTGAKPSEDKTKCKNGTTLIVFDEMFYAVTGGKIVKPRIAPLEDTPEFGTVYSACTGE